METRHPEKSGLDLRVPQAYGVAPPFATGDNASAPTSDSHYLFLSLTVGFTRAAVPAASASRGWAGFRLPTPTRHGHILQHELSQVSFHWRLA